ncbi:MAG: hypothetical protein B6D41_04680 [Chloroflexi bacterium UTCFX4]|nr:MAG: hypothetical protein B6D41_04680 [Chloroflexi bacterium UTCFX4]
MERARFAPLVILALTLLWYVALVIRFPTRGAIGTDPATYVQMALDLAQRGTVVHNFPLFTKLFNQGLSWDAFITPGYHIVGKTGFVVPNFAFGFPLLLAFGYRVFGENALYWMTPLLGAFSLTMTFALANELFRDVSPTRRYWIGALAVLLLATSPKQIQLSLVPMSDVPTQLFCVLAVWCALRVSRPDTVHHNLPFWTRIFADKRGFLNRFFCFRVHPRLSASQSVMCCDRFRRCSSLQRPVRFCTFAALCGLVLGIAYLIRHSAVVLFVPLGIATFRWGNTRREKILLLGVALIVFAITILPDFIYRVNVLGSPFAVESPESAQVNFYDAPRQFLQMLGALFSVTGFGPIVMLAPFAWWILWREQKSHVRQICNLSDARMENRETNYKVILPFHSRFVAAILIAWILAFMLLHAPLVLTGVFENNLRYLVPAYPALALSIAFGFVTLWEWAWRAFQPRRKPYQIRVKPNRWEIALLGAIAATFFLALSLRALIGPERFVARAYGWMSETARNDLNALNEKLPRDAVIGVSDQMAGATLLYAQRDIFRPNNFLEPAREFPQFLQTMKNENRAVFLLGEWNCAGEASERLPEWMEEYEIGDWRLETRPEWQREIRDLPYECSQHLYQFNGE